MTHAYAWFAGVFLVLQGTLTLAARLVPALDAAFPALLEQTQMVPAHSLLHIATALIAFALLRWGGPRGIALFALGFGAFYIGLAVAGIASGQGLCLGLQPFDHPFHILLGGLGVAAAGVDRYRGRAGAASRAIRATERGEP